MQYGIKIKAQYSLKPTLKADVNQGMLQRRTFGESRFDLGILNFSSARSIPH